MRNEAGYKTRWKATPTRRSGAVFVALCLILFVPRVAFAACASPSGNAGDTFYSSTSSVMVYCNGTNWIAMGSNSTTSFGTLTTNNFCTATGSTAIACTTTSTGSGNVVLSAAPTLTGTVTGVSSTWSTGVAIGTTTLSGALNIVGTTNIAGTVNGTSFVGSGASLTGIGTAALGGITGTPSATTYLRGDGTWGTIASGGGATGTGTTGYMAYWTGSTAIGSANVFYSGGNVGIGTAAPTATLTVNGTQALQFGTDYSTSTATQNDVAINTASSMRYTGSGSATFTGIAAGYAGQVLTLTNAATSSYTLTLANQNTGSAAANRIITGTGANLIMANNSSVVLQYDGGASRWRVMGASASLSGLSDVSLSGLASGNLLSYNGSSWVNSTVSSAVTAAVAPSFFAYSSASQTGGTNLVLNVDTVSFDTNSNFNTSTHRYTPTIAGKYIIRSQTICGSSTAQALIYKNGSNVIYGQTAAAGDRSNAVIILDMNGTSDYVTPVGYCTNGASDSFLSGTYGTTFSGALIAPLASGSVAGTGTTNYVPKWTSSTNLTNSLLYDNGTGVGIGTTNPGNLLEVASTSPTAMVDSLSGTGWAILGLAYNTTRKAYFGYYPNSGSGGYAQLSTDGADPLIFGTNGSERIRILSGGNVGIGTTSPSQLLHVYKSANAQIKLQNSNNTNGAYWNDDNGAQVEFGTADARDLYFYTNNTANLVVKSGGNVGIGTTSPLGGLDVAAGLVGSYSHLTVEPSGGAYGARLNWYGSNGRNANVARIDGVVTNGTTSSESADMAFSTATGGTLSERMRILASGQLLIGASAQSNSGLIEETFTGGTNNGIVFHDTSNSGTTYPLFFMRNTTTQVGYVATTTSGTTYNTGSDRRLKENIKPTSRGLDSLMKIQPADFTFITDKDKTPLQGFIAQDLYKIYPEAVTTNGDDGTKPLAKDAQPWAVDYGRVTPLLVKAIQEFKSLFDADHAELAKLKAANDNQAEQIKALQADIEKLKTASPAKAK